MTPTLTFFSSREWASLDGTVTGYLSCGPAPEEHNKVETYLPSDKLCKVGIILPWVITDAKTEMKSGSGGRETDVEHAFC